MFSLSSNTLGLFPVSTFHTEIISSEKSGAKITNCVNKLQEKKKPIGEVNGLTANPATSKLYSKLRGYADTEIRTGDTELSGYAVFLLPEAPNEKSERH